MESPPAACLHHTSAPDQEVVSNGAVVVKTQPGHHQQLLGLIQPMVRFDFDH